jgi:lipopolysaccharide transport system ATP-binding protein
MATVIEVAELSKKFCLGTEQDRDDNLRELLVRMVRAPLHLRGTRMKPGAEEWIWALRDVSFEVQSGDALGIIGANGAGKSTLLKILSRITDPSSGFVRLRGRVASLLEVGTGFHPELTGRENIFLNGAMLGMSKAEIQSKFNDIVAFAELERFLDTPVKRYSSGMYVRLGFAVAAHLEPEILIVDEVLAVGDMAFQKKCLGKMNEFGQEGRTVLFVSHNMAAVQNLCQKAIIFRKGKLEFSGTAKEAVDRYVHSAMGEPKAGSSHIIEMASAPRKGDRKPHLRELRVFAGESAPFNGLLPIGGALRFEVRFRLEKPTADFDPRINFVDIYGQTVFAARASYEADRQWETRSGEQVFICDIPHVQLTPGEYHIDVALVVEESVADKVEDVMRVTIVETDFYGTGRVPTLGVCVLEHHWRPAESHELESKLQKT